MRSNLQNPLVFSVIISLQSALVLLQSDYTDAVCCLIPFSILALANQVDRNLRLSFVIVNFTINVLFNTFWLYEAGAWIEVTLLCLLYSLLYTIPLALFLRRKYLYGMLVWLTWDYAMMTCEISFPLLSLSHYVAFSPWIVALSKLGGQLAVTLFVLSINVSLLSAVDWYHDRYERRKEHTFRWCVATTALLCILSITTYTYYGSALKGRRVHGLSLNTYLECPEVKYEKTSQELHHIYIDKVQKAFSHHGALASFDFVLFPETAYSDLGLEIDLSSNDFIKDFTKEHPTTTFIFGGVTYESPQRPAYSNVSVIARQGQKTIRVVEKNRLVPFNEYIPIPFDRLLPKQKPSFRFFSKSYNQDKSPVQIGEHAKAAIGICYESLYGRDISKTVKNGANVIFFQYNEGWYHSSIGSRKMLAAATIRASENHRYVVGSSNCGYSFLVGPTGGTGMSSNNHDLYVDLFLLGDTTLYHLLGDIIGMGALVLLIGIFVHSNIHPRVSKATSP